MDPTQSTPMKVPDNDEERRWPLADSVKASLQLYFDDLDGHDPAPVYKTVITEVERPLFEAVMEYTQGNQSHAARVLGVSRSTLRKKLKIYGLG